MLPHPVRVVVDSPCGPVAGARVVVTAADGALVSPVGRDDGRPDTLEDRGEQRVEVETGGDGEVPSRRIGELAMEGLAGLDQVAYVRFASVYRDFADARDFEEFIHRLPKDAGSG